MKPAKLEAAIAFAAGSTFSVGLVIAGMTQPSKVLAFLDVAGDWDPSLAFVMVGAIAVYAAVHRFVTRRERPVVGQCFRIPTNRKVDLRLLAGAGTFGIGWGLAGYCPGPGLVSLGSFSLTPLVFVAAMAVGIGIFDAVDGAWSKARAEARSAPPSDAAAARR